MYMLPPTYNVTLYSFSQKFRYPTPLNEAVTHGSCQTRTQPIPGNYSFASMINNLSWLHLLKRNVILETQGEPVGALHFPKTDEGEEELPSVTLYNHIDTPLAVGGRFIECSADFIKDPYERRHIDQSDYDARLILKEFGTEAGIITPLNIVIPLQPVEQQKGGLLVNDLNGFHRHSYSQWKNAPSP